MPSALPDFPSGFNETHLDRIPLSKILSPDTETESRLFEICKTQGFFYLDLTETPRGQALLDAADRLQEVASEAFKVPQAEKEAVSLEKTGTLFGWKRSGITAASDPHKRSDVGQFWNVSKDDVLENHGRHNVAYPSPLKEEIAGGIFKQFIKDAHETGVTILELLSTKLGIKHGEMIARHRITENSGDHVRLTWGPGNPDATEQGGKTEADTRITTYGHTDFGTITMLFNWLGGLQIENSAKGQWEWVRPVPGHAIINLGDAMKEFSGHQLASGKHRVVTAPGMQAKLERYSVVYFVRPEDEVYMDDLTGVKGSNGANGHENGNGEAKRWKAGEWILDQARALGSKIPKK